VIEALEVGRAYSTHSLSAPIDSEEEAGFARIDALASEDRGFEETENRALLAAGFKRLDERERKILHLRFFEGLTQAQIAVEVGLSQMHVSRLIRKALEQLDSELEDGALEDEP
jgi:RNA polymerase sigma-B factor